MRLLVFAALLLPLVANAQSRDRIEGGDGPLYVGKSGRVGCYVYPEAVVLDGVRTAGDEWRVVVVKKLDLLARDSLVSTACDAPNQFETIFERLVDYQEFFYGLRYPHLFIDFGSSPGDRHMEIIDVETEEIAYNDTYFSGRPIEMVRPGVIEFFVSMWPGEGRCPTIEGSTENHYGWEERLWMELATGEILHTGETACSHRQ